MVYVFPAMVADPLRAEPALAVTDIVTFPLPVRPMGDKLTQDRLSDAVQKQCEPEAVTVTEALWLLDEKLPLVGEMPYVQAAAS